MTGWLGAEFQASTASAFTLCDKIGSLTYRVEASQGNGLSDLRSGRW